MNIKYIPVMRFREQERKAFKSVKLNRNITPLFEIISQKPRQNSKKDSIQTLIEETEGYSNIIIDVPIYIKIEPKTKSNVSSFIQPMKADYKAKIAYLSDERLKKSNRFIPVVSYDPNIPFSKEMINEQIVQYRKKFSRLAYRFFFKHYNQYIETIETELKPNDILIFDLDEALHNHTKFINIHKTVTKLAIQRGVSSVVLRSPIQRSLTNTELDNGKIIKGIDNSLLHDYKKIGYSAFGDYAGVKKDDLIDGGRISPGYLFYSLEYNSFYGFKGEVDNASSFTNVLAPNIIQSKVWKEFNLEHKQTCFGCNSINKIYKGKKAGNSQPAWKGFASSHYLQTLNEFLK